MYSVLKKLENSGMVKSYWNMQENQQPGKYYTILADGKKQLEKSIKEWKLMLSVFEELGSLDE
ncbi:MAG TPA: helix-turn-helix transcriptional regulator [Draconibacterium sp.]|nr:helix-turn-helix transcriptional regulator [Draconibacterium sp.]